MAAGVLDGNYYVYLARNRATGNDLGSVSAYAGDYLARIDDRDGRIGYLQIAARAKKGSARFMVLLFDIDRSRRCPHLLLRLGDLSDPTHFG